MIVKQTIFYAPLSIEITSMKGIKRNFPMFTQKSKIFRGVDNNIQVEIKDSDRQVYSIYDRPLRCVLVDPYQTSLRLVKYLQPIDDSKGLYNLLLTSGDLQDWNAGFYQYSIIMTDDNGADVPFYTTLDQEVTGTFELVDKPFPVQVPSHLFETDDFFQVALNNVIQPFTQTFITSRFAGAGQKNASDSIQSFSINLNNFTGTLYFQGSLEQNPANDNEWFNIPFDTANPLNDFVTYTAATAIRNYSVTGNYTWLRFRYVITSANQGSITRIWAKA